MGGGWWRCIFGGRWRVNSFYGWLEVGWGMVEVYWVGRSAWTFFMGGWW